MDSELREDNFTDVAPTRKHRRDGEVFVIHYDMLDGYVVGRVIKAKAYPQGPSGIMAGSTLIYVFKGVRPSKEMPPREHLLASNLLIPPMFVNRTPWSRAGVETIGNLPFEPGEVLQTHCFKDIVYSKPGAELYSDGEQNRLDAPVEPVGTLGLKNIRSMDLRISRALGMPEPTAFKRT